MNSSKPGLRARAIAFGARISLGKATDFTKKNHPCLEQGCATTFSRNLVEFHLVKALMNLM